MLSSHVPHWYFNFKKIHILDKTKYCGIPISQTLGLSNLHISQTKSCFLWICFAISLPLISRTPDFSNQFSFLVEVQENGILLSPVKMCRQAAICPLQSISCRVLHIGLHHEPSSRQGDLVFAAYYSFYVAHCYKTF